MKLSIVLLFSSLGLAQQFATTSAPCSPIASDNAGTITINCPGVSREDVAALLKQNQGNVKVTLAKIEQCNRGIKDVGQQQASRFDEQAHWLEKIQESVDRLNLNPERLLARYRLGYVIFGVDYRNDLFPYRSKTLLEKYDVDWTDVGIVTPKCPVPGLPNAMECGPNQIVLRLPDIGLKGGPKVYKDMTTGGTRRPGPLGGVVVNDLEMDSEILALREDGVVFLVGFNQFRRF